MEEKVLNPRNKKDIEKHKDKFDANLNYFTMYNKSGTQTSSFVKPKDTKNSAENFYKVTVTNDSHLSHFLSILKL